MDMKGYSFRSLLTGVTLFLTIMFSVSGPSYAISIQALETKAHTNDTAAQLELARAYQSGEGIKASQSQALYWYSRAAITGNTEAQYGMGQLFEYWKPTPALEQAAVWYQIAAENNYPEADSAYTHILELQFNQRRARQISSIQQLDQAYDENQAPAVPLVPPQKQNVIRTDVFTVLVVVLLAVLIFTGRRLLRNRKNSQLAALRSHITELKQQVHQLSKKNRTQQKQMGKIYSQLKQDQRQEQQQKLAIAFALLGYTADRLPDNKALKVRYKKLCRIYHPDADGSDEEMKRLNEAVKLISSYKKS
jgi:hypothetical protein